MALNRRLPNDYKTDEETFVAMDNEAAHVLDSISQYIDRQIYEFPQEKIHLHTDRDYYVPGEKIWFKAYLADAATHHDATLSRYVYVELISPEDSVVGRVMVRPENELFHGYISLTDAKLEGNYTLRAYTKYLENLGDDYFFKKHIRIGSLTTPPHTDLLQRREGVGDFDVSFFPEGGNLVEGVSGKVALKVLKVDGSSESIAGIIVDETGAEVISVQTLYAGMGFFSLTPDRAKRYYLQCRNGDGLEKRF
jgi:hypothetical protein